MPWEETDVLAAPAGAGRGPPLPDPLPQFVRDKPGKPVVRFSRERIGGEGAKKGARFLSREPLRFCSAVCPAVK